MEGISLDSTVLEQLHGEQKALLDAIDDLRKHGIGRFVDLPQIIVVGDQSSGKSSVLEAISRVRFPVNDGLCTRFATELVLRTNNQTKVDVRIQPSSTSKDEEHSFDEKSFNKEELPRIIEEAKKKMLKGDAGFSEDVLRIEISSPDVPHLTMVDLPGFYHSEDENQSAAGREIVERLVERYMARKNSIILAIISARNQVILQKVLSKVKHHDKKKQRTLGIITKPDILTSGSLDETNFVRLAKNLDKSHVLSLGWHVLRNRGEKEVSHTDKERDDKEREFFESGVWSSVPSKNRGVESLRKKLSGILLGHIKDNLHGLIQSIEEQVNEHKARLKRLGDPRSTEKELRTHLDRIASQFHILCLQAVEGNYADQFFGGLYPKNEGTTIDDSRIRKIRALIRDLNRAFAYVLETKGSRRIIIPKKSTTALENYKSLDSTGEVGIIATDLSKVTLPPSPQPLAPFLQPLVNNYTIQNPERVTFENIASDLESLSSANQGNEFPGTSNDRLAVKLFQDQAQPWEAIARCHIQLVLQTTKAFVEKLMKHIVDPDERTFSAILSNIVDPFFDEKSVILEKKLQELLFHYKSGYPQPLDSEFRGMLARRNEKNHKVDAIQDLLENQPELFTKEAYTKLKAISIPKPTSEFGVDGLIDKSETYYEMSLRTFIDNVIVLAVENLLIRALPTIFTSERVNQMEDDELGRLASESPEINIERKELQEEYDALMKGLQICNKFKERKAAESFSIGLEAPLETRHDDALFSVPQLSLGRVFQYGKYASSQDRVPPEAQTPSGLFSTPKSGAQAPPGTKQHEGLFSTPASSSQVPHKAQQHEGLFSRSSQSSSTTTQPSPFSFNEPASKVSSGGLFGSASLGTNNSSASTGIFGNPKKPSKQGSSLFSELSKSPGQSSTPVVWGSVSNKQNATPSSSNT
ncbi:P-loop containing nucleoside triphosphate hydrolase protein [Annulohypoxylon maeteangense]|uniref:P-loop containing nucleoside triphosphate hydrolase protein n=1 Tax=Annulohypoxylon maeteangense TaxID=1927788 RepID=UPI0020085FBC|nr:P-loop containing nucleoside triphosphate hydrolase protein [Annulohypoxylon maeteangense]KAI0889375.1 P-loop containing nucleoside triphosphate hydrolase protein [Annulohypoxylon maeteangense]